jgi:hypothetical protein
MVLAAWRDGLGRLLSAPAIVAGVFVVTLTAALPLAMTLRGAMQAHLGSSLMADEAADAVNYDWWQEFTAQAPGLGSTFTPSVIGFATTLDSVSGLLDTRVLITPIAWAVGVYLAAWVFVWGGILDRYARGRRVGPHGFFAASGTFFFRFLRLGIVAGLVYWFLFVWVHEWLFTTWYVSATRDLSVEPRVFLWRLLMYLIFASLLAFVSTVFDYAKVRAVMEDRRSMVGSLVAALRFMVRHPGRVVALYAVNGVIFLLILAAWATVAPGVGGAGMSLWIGVAATQCYVLARLTVRLLFAASATALFQRSLAHTGYTAAPAVARADAPIVEMMSPTGGSARGPL